MKPGDQFYTICFHLHRSEADHFERRRVKANVTRAELARQIIKRWLKNRTTKRFRGSDRHVADTAATRSLTESLRDTIANERG